MPRKTRNSLSVDGTGNFKTEFIEDFKTEVCPCLCRLQKVVADDVEFEPYEFFWVKFCVRQCL